MAFQNSGQSGSQPVASTQIAQKFTVDTSVADFNTLVPIILTRGLPRILVLAQQRIGAAPGIITVQASVSNQVGVNGVPEFFTVGSPTTTPLVTPITLDLTVPTKFLRVQVTKPAANHVTIDIVIMCAQ
jgi:hypothetical protein